MKKGVSECSPQLAALLTLESKIIVRDWLIEWNLELIAPFIDCKLQLPLLISFSIYEVKQIFSEEVKPRSLICLPNDVCFFEMTTYIGIKLLKKLGLILKTNLSEIRKKKTLLPQKMKNEKENILELGLLLRKLSKQSCLRLLPFHIKKNYNFKRKLNHKGTSFFFPILRGNSLLCKIFSLVILVVEFMFVCKANHILNY